MMLVAPVLDEMMGDRLRRSMFRLGDSASCGHAVRSRFACFLGPG